MENKAHWQGQNNWPKYKRQIFWYWQAVAIESAKFMGSEETCELNIDGGIYFPLKHHNLEHCRKNRQKSLIRRCELHRNKIQCHLRFCSMGKLIIAQIWIRVSPDVTQPSGTNHSPNLNYKHPTNRFDKDRALGNGLMDLICGTDWLQEKLLSLLMPATISSVFDFIDVPAARRNSHCKEAMKIT